nr:HAMP domain-containing sensor histidine kinase [uncultured Butyrivibrio sp.]
MVADLRKKFVMVTTTLMLVTFGAFLIVNYIYNNYWNKVETADMLDLIADSGYFLYPEDTGVEQTIKNMTEGASPIAGVIFDSDGAIVTSRVIGGKSNLVVSEHIFEKILTQDGFDYQIDRYLFSKRDLEDGCTLIVIMDTSIDDNMWKKVIITTIFIIIGISVLILITFYLSGYVTEPAKQALLREKRFISDASHELKTPLGAIRINAQALSASEPENLYTKNIINESDRMGRLIERLLTLSRLDEKEASTKERISLSNLVTEMALTYESVAYEQGIVYKYDISDDVSIIGNADEIRQLLTILIDNAIKNTNDKGRIEIRCISENKTARVEVKNTGPGINADDLPHVFERFYTSDTSRSNKSFGLGLAIAKAIAEGHKGNLTVNSIPNEVTVFTAIFSTS